MISCMKMGIAGLSLLASAWGFSSSFAQQYCQSVSAGVCRLVGCNVSLQDLAVPNSSIAQYNGGYSFYQFDDIDLIWTPTEPVIPRGRAAVFTAPSAMQICFNESLQDPALPLLLVAGLNLVSCQSNSVATFEDIVGRAPVEGAVLYKFVGTTFPASIGPPDFEVYTYTNGAWHPSVPIAEIGEGVFIAEPTVFAYYPQVLNWKVSGNAFSFQVETVYGKAFTIEQSDSPQGEVWNELSTFVGNGHRTTIVDETFSTEVPSRYYRVKVAL